jgi:hypothetical protein
MKMVPIHSNRKSRMYAVFTEVNADGSHIENAREMLPKVAVPAVREQGAVGGYWLAPEGGRGVSVVVFETEEEARAAAAPLKVGDQVGPVPGVTWKTIEVREVLAHL